MKGVRSLRIGIAAICFVAAPLAHAQIYKWVDKDGAVTYSNQPPPAVQDELPAQTLEPAPPVTPAPAAEPASAQPAPVEVERTIVISPPPSLVPPEPVTLSRDPAPQQREVEAPRRVIPRSTLTEAVQDPCLTSPDPRCAERNRDRYHPFLGYAPGVTPATGASSGAGGGVVGGRVPAPQSSSVPATPRNPTATPSSAYALPPGSAPPASLPAAKQPAAR